ncbi:glutaredoxin [Salmonella enterica subsp. arizonae]|uniref:Glutaredoxin n=1 Tax=Salmonella enterica subsp. arizonae TaxID=59203 RepID=A0A379SH79_SALER|nr:glutaredoxin [Salmonella enterica subsp. arizonae]
MKLYIYDHCPFCVKARMIFGLKNIPVELNVLQNDDEATPTPDDWSKDGAHPAKR